MRKPVLRVRTLVGCLFFCVLSIASTGCSKEDNATATQLSTLPPDPGTAAAASIRGVDTNQNGVRDEVEITISKVAKDEDDKAKMTAIASEYQKALDSTAPDVAKINNTIACVELSRTAESRALLSSTELYYIVFDTPERRAVNNGLDGVRGTVTGSPEDLTCN